MPMQQVGYLKQHSEILWNPEEHEKSISMTSQENR